LKKGLLTLTMRLQCSSGMEMLALAASALAMVACPVHRPLTDLCLIPLLRLKLMKMKVKKEKKKMTMMSEASSRPPHIFLVINDKGGEISIKARRPSSRFSQSFCLLILQTAEYLSVLFSFYF
jgi:hypothetical protein